MVPSLACKSHRKTGDSVIPRPPKSAKVVLSLASFWLGESSANEPVTFAIISLLFTQSKPVRRWRTGPDELINIT
jgi:hypothetical protein